MQISRNQPGVNTCDNCRAEKRPVVSWTCLDTSDNFGASIVGTVHLCENCLAAQRDKLASLPPFLEVMRYELQQIGIDVPPKALLAEIQAQYEERGLGKRERVDFTAMGDHEPVFVNVPEPRQPTIPEIRRMSKPDLQVEIARYALNVEPESLTREQMIEELVRYFERLAAGSAV